MIQLFWKDKNRKLVYCCISTDDVWMVHGWLMMYWYWCNLMCGWFWMCKLLGVLVIDSATCHFLKPNELTMYFLRGNTLLVDWCLMYHCRGKLPRILSKEVWWWVFDVHWVPWYLCGTWPMCSDRFGICWYRPEDWKQQPGNGSFGPCILRGIQSTTARKIDSKRLQLPTDDVSSFKHFQSQCSGRALLEVYDEASRNSFVTGRSFWEGHVNVGSWDEMVKGGVIMIMA